MSLVTKILVMLGRAAPGTSDAREDDRGPTSPVHPTGTPRSGSGTWNRIKSVFERTDIGADSGTYSDSRIQDEEIRSTATRYTPIKQAVERRINTFLRQDVVSHLEIGHNDVFFLHYIEIHAEGHGEALLTEFLKEFPPASRIDWAKKLLGPEVGQHVRLDQFLGLNKDFAPEDLAKTDPDPFEEALNQSAEPPTFRITLYGRWEKPQTEAQPVREYGSFPPRAPRVPGPRVRLIVQDAKLPSRGPGGATRVVEFDEFPAVLGSSSKADVEISGYYVSAGHCMLHWDGRQVWLEDHSKNGTWLDGQRVAPATRIALADGAVLSFGREKGDTDYDRYPTMRTQLIRRPVAPGVTNTPLAPSGTTPVTPAAKTPIATQAPIESAPLAVLAIMDATGTSKRDVLKLPFTIGRGSDQDYVVPDANQGASRKHLVIEELTDTGAVVFNKAVSKNGTFAGDQELSERFVWSFDQEIVLARKWTRAQVVRLSLRRVK